MRFPVFLDTNALYPASLADTLLRLAEADVIRPHWSAHVMEELTRNLADRIPTDLASRRAQAMQTAFPEAMVTGYENLIDGMTNDIEGPARSRCGGALGLPSDRHI